MLQSMTDMKLSFLYALTFSLNLCLELDIRVLVVTFIYPLFSTKLKLFVVILTTLGADFFL